MQNKKIYIDGASRGNPGKAGIGCIFFDGERKIFQYGYKIPNCTNNVAEYSALLVGLYYSKEFYKNDWSFCKIEVYSDSLLLVNQCMMRYKVNNNNIKKAFNIYKSNFFGNVSFVHILREYNKDADILANKGIDEETELPENIFNFLLPIFA